MTKLLTIAVVVILSSLACVTAGISSDKVDHARSLESAVESSDDLGKFYYPVSLLKLPKDQRQVLTPLNTKSGEKYTISTSRDLSSEELNFNTNTGELSLYHKNESTTGEVIITVISSSKNEYAFIVDFLDDFYFEMAKYVYATPYWADCPQTTVIDIGSGSGYLTAGPLDFFGFDLTKERMAELFRYDMDNKGDFRFLYINITGELKVEIKSNYTFFIQSDYGSLIEVDGNIVVSNYFTCNGSSVELSSSNIILDVGYHSIKLHVISGMKRSGSDGMYGGYGFDFKYKIGDGEKQHFTLYNKIEYKEANSLIFFKSNYAWGKDVYQEIEFTVSDADFCTSNPPLETGLKIKLGKLYGISSSVDIKTYSIYCVSTHANTNIFNITIEVTDIFLPGLIAYYMKYDTFGSVSNLLPNRNEKGSHLKVLRIEEIANKEYNADITVWKGLGAEFMSEFGVHWEGVIKYPKSGTYSYKITCDDSCALKLKDNFEIRVFSYTGNKNSTMTKDIKVYDDDELSQYFMLEYMQYKGSSVVELLLKGPDDTEYHYPSELLFYNPPSRLEYTYIISSYLVDVVIPISNKPLFNGITIEDDDKPIFSINKDLPSGITFDKDNGYIEGLPTEAIQRDEFTITATFKKREALQTTIFITVEDIKIPTNVYLFNQVTSEKYYKTGNIQLGVYINLIISEDSGTNIAGYYLTGDLPKSLFDADKASLVGYAKEVGEFSLFVQACNGVGCTSSNITITVEDKCGEDENLAVFTLSKTSKSYEFSLDDSTGKSVINAIQINQPTEMWSKSICLKNGEYTVNIWNDIGYYTPFQTEILMNGIVISNLTKYGAGISGGKSYVKFQATFIPSPINYKSTEMVFEQYLDNNYRPSYYNVLNKFKIEPDTLPEGITFDNTGVISGMSTKNSPKRNYTITAYTLSDQLVSVDITLEVILTKCIEKGYALLHIYTFASGYGVYNLDLEIRDSNNNVTLAITPQDSINSHIYKCIPQGDYTLKCETKDGDGAGWNGGYADVFFYEAPMGHCSIKSGDGPHGYTASLQLHYGVDANTEWEYSSKYEPGWYKNSFTGRWSTSKISNINSNGNTLYLRKIIQIHDINSISAFYTRIDVLSGFVYYANETEVGRINLPQGELTDTQKATNKFEMLTPVTYVLPIAMFNDQAVLIAVELHKYDDNENLNEARFYSVDLNGDSQESCTRLNTFGTVSEAYPQSTRMNYKEYAMDSNEISYYSGSTSNLVGSPYLTIDFGEYTFVYINRFMFVNPGTFLAQDNPLTIDINERTTEGIKKITTLDIRKPDYDYEIFDTDIYENIYLANQLQLNMTANPKRKSITIADFMPGVCQIFYCIENDILPYTKGGDNITIACPSGLTGSRTFLCPTGKKPQWREIENTCPIKPEILTKIDKYSFITGKSEEGIVFFTYTGFIKTITVNPALPSCIKQQQDISYGIYNAKCLSEMSLTSYTFTLTNDFGTTDVQLSISIDHSNSPIITSYVSSYTFYVGIKSESVQLFIVIGTELDISVNPSLPQGLVMDEYTGKISGTPIEVLENGNFTFTIKNQYDSVGIMIKVNVLLSDSPIVLEKVDSYLFYYGVNYNDLVLYQIAGKSLTYFVSSGELPKSMKLDEKSGNIYGQITDKEPSSGKFTVTATTTSEGKKVDVIIPFTIEETKKPVVIKYKDEYVLTYGNSVDSIKLFEDSGKNITYTVNPSLPEGLSLNEKTGEISGTVKSTTGSKYYTFYLRNSDGETSIQILLSFTKPIIPVLLSYNDNVVFIKNMYIEPIILFEVTAREMKYKCDTELPDGIKFNEVNGLISGTPVSDSKNKTYIFTVYNDHGSVNVSINIEVIIKYCSKDGDWGRTEMGAVNYLGCKGAYSGNKYRKCIGTDNGDAVWGGTNDDCTMQTGLIVGIVVVCIVAVALIILVIIFLIFRRNAVKKVNSDKKKQIISSEGIHM